jgi:hypothetical protein
LLALSALALPAALRSGTARASIRWCRADPGLRVGDQEFHVNLASDQAMLDDATGKVALVVHVPPTYAAETELLDLDDGFGFSYDLKVQESDHLDDQNGIDIVVEVYAPATDDTLPVKVEVDPIDRQGGTKQRKGNANEWIVVDNIKI